MPETSKPDKTSNPDKTDITANSAEYEFEAVPQPAPIVPDYGQRIRILAGAIIIAGLAYTFGWYWFGNQLTTGTTAAINDAALNGKKIVCEEPAAKGYPFRMGLTCAKTGYADSAQNLILEAGAFRSAAQVYQPSHIIGELDGPLSITINRITPLTVNWALAHASFIGDGGLPARVSLEIEKPTIADTKTPTLQIGSTNLAAFHMRQGENNQIDIASNIEGAKIKDAPVFNFSGDASISGATRFDAALESGKPLIDVLRGNQGEVRNVNLTFVDGGSLVISGSFSLSKAGQISGTFSVKASQAAKLIDNLSLVGVALGAPANNFAAIKSMAINDQFNLTITVKNGDASMGFIPLGKIPAL